VSSIQRSLVSLSLWSFAVGSGAPLFAQCGLDWLPGQGVPGVMGTVNRLHWWDRDGAGPATEVLLATGAFVLAGDVAAPGFAAWDPTTGTWSAMGAGVFEAVAAVASFPNGDLVVSASTLAGSPGFGVFRFDGSAWSPLGGGVVGSVNALAVLPNGDLVAAGGIGLAGGTPVQRAARWNGSVWSDMGPGIGHVTALAVGAQGELYAASDNQGAVLRWTGTAWQVLGQGVGGLVTGPSALAVAPNGDVYVGGARGIARWNGSQWSGLGSGVGGTENGVLSLQALPDGSVVAGGNFTLAGGSPVARIARWNGAQWGGLGGGMASGVVLALARRQDGTVQAGGHFFRAGGTAVDRIATWNGTAWSTLSPGLNGNVRAVLELADGSTVIGGAFTAAGGQTVNGIAKWDGSTWSAFGSGCNGVVTSLLELPNGGLIAAGTFTSIGGQPIRRVARWDGSAWVPLGAELNDDVLAMVRLPNGDVVLGGEFDGAGPLFTPAFLPSRRLIRWDGNSYQPLSLPGTAFSEVVTGLLVLDNGNLAACGSFAGGVLEWNGSSWSPLGGGLGAGAGFLTRGPGGSLYAVANGVWRWQGAAWSQVAANASIRAFAVLPNGDLVAGLNSFPAPAPLFLARWDGFAWQPLPGLGGGLFYTTPFVDTLTLLPSGQLAVGGFFWQAGSGVSAYLARLASSCPASATNTGGGCAGSATLRADLPWLGVPWRAVATGLPANSFVFAVVGLLPAALPLPQLFPSGVAGCELRVDPVTVQGIAAAGDRVQYTLNIPNEPGLLGLVLHHQMLPLELVPALPLTATDAVQLTLGRW
jgi:trimeric autotransporter adhesin